MRTFFQVALAAAVFATATGTAFATPFSTYMTTVHLRDGKQVVCAVNEPRSMQPAGMQTLSTRERIEAQIDATARLRRHLGNKNHYPSAATAPRIDCT
ncbi:hypothetical protein [Paraburkholderia sp.]|uniref:hypothetical protein n=1 Tax=Paraburkholderia sp. TaxID=1926495 RepID=UPI002D326E51|nr:hypothetical protein [Paraburkholderia sp.]HZZ03335.1 hypothetical protein [Paraburkholderia sp.]